LVKTVLEKNQVTHIFPKFINGFFKKDCKMFIAWHLQIIFVF
jgi:hypothetical protein